MGKAIEIENINSVKCERLQLTFLYGHGLIYANIQRKEFRKTEKFLLRII